MTEECPNCGDGSGWQRWRGEWVACADCNDDGEKPKPMICPACRNVPAFCRCAPLGVVLPIPDDYDYREALRDQPEDGA